MKATLERIAAGDAAIGVMGLGHAGLVEAMEFAHSGFQVTGFDIETLLRKMQESGLGN